MKSYEIAAIRLAIKRVLKSSNINVGYRYLNNWYKENKDSLVIDIEKIKNEFKIWVDSQYINK